MPARGTSSTPAAFKPVRNALLVVYSRALATQPSEKSRCSTSIGMGGKRDGVHADDAHEAGPTSRLM